MNVVWRSLFLGFCVLNSLVTQGAEAPRAKPNVVILFVDDLGYADIGPFGATKQQTPHLDRMAREGLKLTSFYAAPVCSVSRAQLLTGCYGVRVSVPGVFFPGSKLGLHPNEFTMAERLKEHGYATMCIGKWHLGDQPEFLPTKQGFDRYFGIPYSNDMQKVSAESGQSVVPLLRDDKVIELLNDEQQRQIVERYTNEAVSFIRDNRERQFLLYLPHSAVHTPIWPGEKFRGKSQNGRFGDWVEEVDWSVGRVLDTLRELKLDRDTCVIFTSDNGPWLIKGSDGGSALPLRGGKGSTWEGGVRVPTIAWWPGRIAAGTTCDAVAGTIDLLPTMVSLAGGQVPAEPVIDGRDLSPILFGRSQLSPRETHFYFSGTNLQAVRQGPWKLALANQPEVKDAKAAVVAMQNPRLYHLDRDIGEQTNLADQHPEIVTQLQKLAEQKDAEIGGAKPTSRRPAGEVEHPTTLYPIKEAKPASAKPAETKGNAQAEPPIDWKQLKVGAVVPGDTAPRVGGRAFAVTCQITTQAQEGIVLAHGGAVVGYALHLRGGKLIFTLNHESERHDLTTTFPSTGKTVSVSASLARDGTMTLQVDDQPAVTHKAPGCLPRQPLENFCVGHDDKMPVGNYASTERFKGEVTAIQVTAPRDTVGPR